MKIINKIIVPAGAVLMLSGAVMAQGTGVDFQESTNSVLAALGVTTTLSGNVVVQQDLLAVIAAAIANGESDDYINALVMEAHSQGAIEVPDDMTDDAGNVNTEVLLETVVSAAIADQATQETIDVDALEAEAADEDHGNDAEEDDGHDDEGEIYIVKSGDTLLHISEHAYGTGSLYQKILDANPQVGNANLILVGMELVIPPAE